MQKIITWSTPAYAESVEPHEMDCLFCADDVVRYNKFASPFSLKYCRQGNIPYFIENQNINLPAGACLTINEGTVIECLPCRSGTSATMLYFTRSLLHDVWQNRVANTQVLLEKPLPAGDCPHFFEHVFRNTFPITGRLEQISRIMRADGHSQTGLSPDLFYELAEQWFDIQGNIDRQMGGLNAGTMATRRELYRRVLAGRELMHDQWNRPLTLKMVARQACLSPYHFHRSFREAFGVPPMQWLRHLRLEQAEIMLRSQTGSVADIAFACGFSDIFVFSKAFKRFRGVPPTATS